MKIQTYSLLKSLTIDGVEIELPESQTIELEFSAIDTGGGFRDAILDFSINIPQHNGLDLQEFGNNCEIVATMQNPDEREREVTFSYQAEPVLNDEDLELNGRLQDDQLSRKVIGFMLHLLR